MDVLIITSLTRMSKSWMESRSDSGYVWNKHFELRFARGTSSDGDPVPQEIFRSPLSAVTMYTTATDYARFLASVVGDEAVMKAIFGAAVEVDQDLGFDWGLG